MTFVELAQDIDQATKELDESLAIVADLESQLLAANIGLKTRKDHRDDLMAKMRSMLGLVTIDSQDTQALKQLALDGQKLRNR